MLILCKPPRNMRACGDPFQPQPTYLNNTVHPPGGQTDSIKSLIKDRAMPDLWGGKQTTDSKERHKREGLATRGLHSQTFKRAHAHYACTSTRAQACTQVHRKTERACRCTKGGERGRDGGEREGLRKRGERADHMAARYCCSSTT